MLYKKKEKQKVAVLSYTQISLNYMEDSIKLLKDILKELKRFNK